MNKEYDTTYCQACNGSGEGGYDGSTCKACGGIGEELVERNEDDYEPCYDDEAKNE